jgi:hypothetical protein
MEQSKIVRYIQSLSRKEQEKFHQYVISPCFNQHAKTIQLLECILHKPRLLEDRKKLFGHLHPGELFEEQRLHNLFSSLKKLYVKFLSYQQLEANEPMQQLFALEQLSYMGNEELLLNRSQQLEKLLNNKPTRNIQDSFVGYRLNYLLSNTGEEDLDEETIGQQKRMIGYLNHFFLAEQLKLSCSLMAYTMVSNSEYDFSFLEFTLGYIHQHPELLEQNRLIHLYYNILMSQRDGDNPLYYLNLKMLLADQLKGFEQEERANLYAAAYNFCIAKINKGENEYRLELFEWYKEGLKYNLLLTNDTISEWQYKNITTLGCVLKEFNWTEQFIEEYRDKLPEDKRENAYNYNLANLYFHKNMFNEVKDALKDVQFTDPKYYINANLLLLRSYYALRDTEALLYLIEAFRIFVIRNRKIPTEQKRGYTNFLRFAKKLVMLKHHDFTYAREDLSKKIMQLRSQIEKTENLFNRYWLLEECH